LQGERANQKCSGREPRENPCDFGQGNAVTRMLLHSETRFADSFPDNSKSNVS
jgi:hypothetical protein